MLEAKRIRVYIGEQDHFEGKPLYEALVMTARESGLAGATVFRGLMGFGGHSHLHTAKLLRLSEDLPVVVEIIDAKARIEAFLPKIEAMVVDGSVTVESVQLRNFTRDEKQEDA